MKVGILTFHQVNNYGAVLQTYALQKAIQNLGHEAETIDYECRYINKPYTIKNLVKKGFLKYIIGIAGKTVYSLRTKRMNQFRKHISFSRYVNKQSIMQLNDEYNLFIAGSDQVWNPNLTNFDTTYFLDFVKDKSKRGSYAPSIGVKNIDTDIQGKYCELLKGFKYLSVRENSGAEAIKSVSGLDAKVVADPTILLTKKEWLDVTKENTHKKDYILLYQLWFSSDMLKFTKKLAKDTGCEIICLPFPMGRPIKCKCNLTAGPSELLGLIKNAKYVVTSSYHGMVLSIIFNKNFFMEAPSSLGVDSRIQNLLNELNLLERQVIKGVSEKWDKPIDYKIINKKLNDKRTESLAYLRKMLLTSTGRELYEAYKG